MSEDFRFRILGPLTVEFAGENIRLGGPRQQALLAILLLESNHVVAIERLVDAIWNDSPPASAKNQVRICVSGLRRLFADKRPGTVIETYGSGYRILVPRGALDLSEFEELTFFGRAAADAGSTREAVDVLRQALGLWRGLIGSGLDSRLAESLATKFHEERLAALEDCYDLELALGRHRKLVGELACLVAEHPFREKTCGQLMLALSRSGRKVEALELFRTTRKKLSEELGLEPGESLRELEYSILNSDSGPGEPLSAPDQDRPAPQRRVISARLGHTPPPQPEHRRTEDRRTEDRLDRLERENARLRAEHAAFKRAMDSWMKPWEADA
ncbi:AfsR/SARP family transcriptional regulator [Streptomyces sp. H27-D2]|uniref:AfsR/SARP family transcriptional regulator n=1 Tax=Streptomyces sp. H27-D2 TaxID=3046304 RepID=UPI002DBC4C5A|nr:AfsR/SARP family transcriptional regulator [Streptomyces sp. H27-D2]MEC4019417.1 AfsR/SARP family transcriptional regulator [Streptomyces sp. H27-D2]